MKKEIRMDITVVMSQDDVEDFLTALSSYEESLLECRLLVGSIHRQMHEGSARDVLVKHEHNLGVCRDLISQIRQHCEEQYCG